MKGGQRLDINLRVDFYEHPNYEAEAQLEIIIIAIDKLTQIIKTLVRKEIHEMADINVIKQKIAETLTEVTAQGTKVDSIDALMDGMRDQIAALLASQGASDEILATITQVFDEAKKNSAKIDVAIAENTPAEPPPPPPVE